jgi:hypothetical protein
MGQSKALDVSSAGVFAGAIKRKRSKDTLILAGVITACSLFLIIYWISK